MASKGRTHIPAGFSHKALCCDISSKRGGLETGKLVNMDLTWMGAMGQDAREWDTHMVKAPPIVPLEVFQEGEEGNKVGVRQRSQQVHHAVLLGSRVRQHCGGS